MAWVLLKNSGALQLLQKLSVLQVKLTELAARQKMNDMQMNMLGTEKNGRPDPTQP